MGLNTLTADSSEPLLEGAVNRHVYLKSSTGADGYDINKDIVEYVGIKEGPDETGGGFKYCATFKRGNEYFDVDLFIVERNGTYNVVKESLHKRKDRLVSNSLRDADATRQGFDPQLAASLEKNKRIVAVIAE